MDRKRATLPNPEGQPPKKRFPTMRDYSSPNASVEDQRKMGGVELQLQHQEEVLRRVPRDAQKGISSQRRPQE